MSPKSVATRSSSRLKAQEFGGERSGEYGESQIQVQGHLPDVAPAAPTSKDDFMATDDFRRLLRGYMDVTVLFYTFRLVSKPWQRIAEEEIDREFESGVLTNHGGNDINCQTANARRERRKLVTRVIFLLNITKVGDGACCYAANLVVVDIPEGVTSIGDHAFCDCSSLTIVSFPRTLTSIVAGAFAHCRRLDNVDLLHTNLQELGDNAFEGCLELKSMTIPDSLQTLGYKIFADCFKLVPFCIDGQDSDAMIEYLRFHQERVEIVSNMITKREAEVAAKKLKAALRAENATVSSRIAQLEI
ncbi:hypothetical protein TL16_g05205 [Triparma laevis f. inornata]|uniref:Uncharacterized protein n=1 Tax=Triparma laevis f. inornata TaxID=1714386 RepID=A0A9W7EB39_9STRA|nr:hypothetical protein TL16_g05205 [Triparma laevis f. inornata]